MDEAEDTTMTFQQAVQEIDLIEGARNLEVSDQVLCAAIRQIEANRIAIQELRREYRNHRHDTTGMSRLTDTPS